MHITLQTKLHISAVVHVVTSLSRVSQRAVSCVLHSNTACATFCYTKMYGLDNVSWHDVTSAIWAIASAVCGNVIMVSDV